MKMKKTERTNRTYTLDLKDFLGYLGIEGVDLRKDRVEIVCRHFKQEFGSVEISVLGDYWSQEKKQEE